MKRAPIWGNQKYIPESLRSKRRGEFLVRDRGNGLKIQPVVYRWMNGVGWLLATSNEVMKMKAINHKPMIRPKGTLALQGGEEVRSSIDSLLISHLLDLKFSASQIIWFK